MVASETARLTNMNCEVISTVKHDKSEPVVDITYGKNYRTTSNRRTLWDHDWSFAGFFFPVITMKANLCFLLTCVNLEYFYSWIAQMYILEIITSARCSNY